MKRNNASKAAIGTGGTLVTVGAAMISNPVTLAPGVALLVAGVVTGFFGALFHDSPSSKTNEKEDDE